jgi:phosphoserine aminotransferase
MRPYNFSAGPAALPEPVLALAAAEMLDWHGSGMGVMEMSHRGREFISIYEQAEADLRELLAVPAHFHILFMQGGGLAENAIVPLNLSRGGHGGRGGHRRLVAEVGHRGAPLCRRAVAASNAADGHTSLPDPAGWQSAQRGAYVHLCSNETIHGVEYHQLPDLAALGCDAPLVIDCSSHILSRPIDWSRVGLAFAGAQKNIGPAGLTLVIVRDDLLGHALPVCPSAFDYKTVADNGSMFNTPPTYAIYIAGLVFQWIKARGRRGGDGGPQHRQGRAAVRLPRWLGLLRQPGGTRCRSRMNVPFFLNDERLNDAFLAGAKERGLLQLKGHKSVGGMRASIYNAMPLEGVQALVAYLKDFAQRHG